MARADVKSDKDVSALCRCFTDSQLRGSRSRFLPRVRDQLLHIRLQPFLFHQDRRNTVSSCGFFLLRHIHVWNLRINASTRVVLCPVDIYNMSPGGRAGLKQGGGEESLFFYGREVGFCITLGFIALPYVLPLQIAGEMSLRPFIFV